MKNPTAKPPSERHDASPTVTLLMAALCVGGAQAPGQDKKIEKKDRPRITMTVPLGAAPAATGKLTIRGLKLENANAIHFAHPKVGVKLLSKGKAPAADKYPEKVGDTQIEVEIAIPADVPDGPLPFTVLTPLGEIKHHLLIESKLPVIREKEANDGFIHGQQVMMPVVIDGLIQSARDVDVFRFEGTRGQRVAFEVLAARHGSALDSALTLHDARGQQVATSDDTKDSTDSLLEVTLPADGTYYLSLIDAHDTGGPAHVYRLIGRIK